MHFESVYLVFIKTWFIYKKYALNNNSKLVSFLISSDSKVASIVEQYNKKSKGSHRLSVSKSAEFCSSIEPEGHRPVVSMPILTHWNGLPQNGLSQNGLPQNGLPLTNEDDSEGMTLSLNEWGRRSQPWNIDDTCSHSYNAPITVMPTLPGWWWVGILKGGPNIQNSRSNLAEEIQFLEFLLIQLCCGNGYKHFIVLVSVHITIIAFMDCIFTCFRLVKIPCLLVHTNSCNKVYLLRLDYFLIDVHIWHLWCHDYITILSHLQMIAHYPLW